MISNCATDRDGIEGVREHPMRGVMHVVWRQGTDGGYTLVGVFPTRHLAVKYWSVLSDGNTYVIGVVRADLRTRPEFRQHYSGRFQQSKNHFNDGPADRRQRKGRE